MMELKQYQAATLETFSKWLENLRIAKAQSEQAAVALQNIGHDVPDDVRNYPKTAWQKMKDAGEIATTARKYISRTDDAGRPIPHACFKVPTGGGKTLLATAALERMNRPTGLTLWITPTRAIYEQTKTALKNREHPYREMLERASGGRVKLLEKDDPLTNADVANYLCVMLLMLPAANRQKGREFLRMFRNSGRYPTLFPDSDDALGDSKLLQQHPDLDRISENGPVKHSLYNIFKMLRPVVVLDEAHKAYGATKRDSNEDFVRSVNRLDPSLVIELSATPNAGISNLLVDITGVELKNEEMIKLPVQVTSFSNTDWRHTLSQARDQLEKLRDEAVSFQMSEGRYIRPIAVVRVERTGKDQRDGERIHAEDVREYLTTNLGIPLEQVAVKSADINELSKVDLMSEFSPVRWIITKAALMEGWDCPFAYLLVMLDNTQSQRAITQLVGRVMRQPHAERTDRETLDQCYVYCCNTDVGAAVEQVKNGLEQEGLTGLDDAVTANSPQLHRVKIQRKQQFRNKDIFLPVVNHREGDTWQELGYQNHILPEIDWDAIDTPDPQSTIPDAPRIQQATVDVGETAPVFHSDREIYIDKTVKISWFVRRLTDIVPNPWQSARIVQNLVRNLKNAGQSDSDIYDQRSNLATQLHQHVANQIEKQAEEVFKAKLANGDIRFDLEATDHNHRLRQSHEILVGANHSLLQLYGKTVQKSLFEPVYEYDFNELERRFAFYLDEQKMLKWWHRVAVRQTGDYYLRGWRQDRIWPDFIAMGTAKNGQPGLLIFETKGQHLKGNDDTEYKKRVFEALEKYFEVGRMTIHSGPAKGAFRLVFDRKDFPDAQNAINQIYP